MDGLSKRRQSENCVHGLCCSPAHPSLGCESYMLQSRVWNADPGRGTAVVFEKTACRERSNGLPNWESLWKMSKTP